MGNHDNPLKVKQRICARLPFPLLCGLQLMLRNVALDDAATFINWKLTARLIHFAVTTSTGSRARNMITKRVKYLCLVLFFILYTRVYISTVEFI